MLVYTAYVSEVYRAGIESVHPSQSAAARSLGLTHLQALWYVIVPQAVRRVIPPLLNDFIGLQKDTALVGVLGAIEAFKQTQIDEAATFNFTSGLVAALLFVAITIPLARLTDWLVARDRRRQLAGATVHERRSSLENVHKSFGKAEVLRGIDLDVAEHEVVCLIGASGLREVDAAPLREPARADRRGADRRPRAGDHRRRTSTSTRCGAGSGSSSRRSTSSRT